MDRRAFTRLVGVALTVGLAGCAGSSDEESSGVESAGFDVVETDDGALAADLGVSNASDEAVTETVTARATIDGEDHTESKEVTLDPGEETTVRFEFDVPYDEARSGDFEIRGEIGE